MRVLEVCHGDKKEILRRVQAEAARLATQPGVTKTQVGGELGINANLLSRWCRDDSANGGAAFPGQGKPRDEEMASLKRELARVK
jgi:transposase